MRKLPALVVLVFLSAACGGDESLPALSSPVAPTPGPSGGPATDLTISGPDVVLTGANVLYDVTATLSNAVMIYHASAVWHADDTAVATINGNGVLTGRSQGTTTITATYRGKSASVTVRVSPGRSNPSAGSANVVISFSPNPVAGSKTVCAGAGQQAPSWSFFEVYDETQGVGFTQHLETVNLYTQSGLLDTSSFREEYYFAPSSTFIEAFDTCVDLRGATSGIFEEILDGTDDRGNQVTFINRVELLPPPGSSATPSRTSTSVDTRPVIRSINR